MGRHLFLIYFAVALTAAAGLHATHAFSAESGAASPRVVNVTSDSQSGWIPSEDLERQARKTASDYLAAQDGGQYTQAYALVAEMNRKDQPFATFSNRIRDFNARSGASLERRITTVTWTKDSSKAPLPGIFVALDLVSRFAKIERHCGYLVLYQSPSGGDFLVMREESNFMDNATAAGFSEEKAQQVWTSLSANCPGYKPPVPETKDEAVGYPSVDAALAALHSQPGVVFKVEEGWTVAEDTRNTTIWSFPPKGHPAYPSAVKRQLVTDAKGTSIQMSVHCEASKEACDNLVRSFEQLNNQAAASAHQ